jgi:hypothetical protein
MLRALNKTWLVLVVLALLVAFTMEPTILSGGNRLATEENFAKLAPKGMTIAEVEAILGEPTFIKVPGPRWQKRRYVGKRGSDCCRPEIHVLFYNGRTVGGSVGTTYDPTFFRLIVDSMARRNERSDPETYVP